MPTRCPSRPITMSRNAITTALRPRSLVALLALGALAACSEDSPTAPAEAVVMTDQASATADRVSLCHRSGSGGVIVEVPPEEVPDITLRGALVMELKGGRATGKNLAPLATTLALQPEADGFAAPLIVANAHPSGSAGHGLTVEGLAFESGNGGGFAVLSLRVRRLVIQGDRFEAGFGVTLDLRATRALVARNEMTGTLGCDMCLSGPGAYQVTGNRLLGG